MITIVDYGMGNTGSVSNMIKKVGGSSKITSDAKELQKAQKILLPGVGAFDNAIKNLKKLALWDVIIDKAMIEKVPVMGICLGMQLLTKGSEEGDLEGFGFVDAYTSKFGFLNEKLPIPHMGWNSIKQKKESKLFLDDNDAHRRFYFVHSYAVNCNCQDDILTTTFYGYDFVSSFEKNNIIGCQFHPEKSHRYGMNLFQNFVENY